jgi:hypothetical protein
MQPERVAGPLVYAVIAVAGTTVIGILLHWVSVSAADARGVPFVLAAMWMPALARWIAVNTVDRGWRSPFPLRRWSAPRWAAIAIPLVSVATIYLGAYGLSSLFHVPRSAPVWTGRRLIPNIVVNLVLASTLGMTGALGEGSALLLGEAGLFPVLCYLGAAVLVFLNIHGRGGGWASFARSVVLRS